MPVLGKDYMRGTIHLVTIAALIQAAVAWADPAGISTPQQAKWCEGIGNPTPDMQIIGCTAAILSGEFLGNKLALAYRNRGIAYRNKREYAFAISDLDQAILLDPGDALAFYNRGIAKQKNGYTAAGNTDIAQARRLQPGIKQ